MESINQSTESKKCTCFVGPRIRHTCPKLDNPMQNPSASNISIDGKSTMPNLIKYPAHLNAPDNGKTILLQNPNHITYAPSSSPSSSSPSRSNLMDSYTARYPNASPLYHQSYDEIDSFGNTCSPYLEIERPATSKMPNYLLNANLFERQSSSLSSHHHRTKEQERNWNNNKEKLLTGIIHRIQNNENVLVLMRGPPGSGKSYMARQLIDKLYQNQTHGQYHIHIFSADSFFYDQYNVYRYDRNKLSTVHESNYRAVKKAMRAGNSPVIVDNTNILLWEMDKYVSLAIQCGYKIEILETMDSMFVAEELAQRNVHGVNVETVQRMLRTYESATVSDLLNRNSYYKVSMQNHPTRTPLINSGPNFLANKGSECNNDYNHKHNNNNDDEANYGNMSTSTNVNPITMQSTTPYKKQQALLNSNCKSDQNDSVRENFSNIIAGTLNDTKPNKTSTSGSILSNTSQQPSTVLRDDSQEYNEWRSFNAEEIYEIHDNKILTYRKLKNNNSEEATEQRYQSKQQRSMKNLNKEKKHDEELQKHQQHMFNLLNENRITADTKEEASYDNENDQQCSMMTTESEVILEKHRKGCLNENEEFVHLRQIGMNNRLDNLWDLFVKCKGDAMWAVNLLLTDSAAPNEDNNVNDFDFDCNCGKQNQLGETLLSTSASSSSSSSSLSSSVIKQMEMNDMNSNCPLPNTMNDAGPSSPHEKPRKKRIKRNKKKFKKQPKSQSTIEIQKLINEKFNIPQENDSIQVQKIRNMRHPSRKNSPNRCSENYADAPIEIPLNEIPCDDIENSDLISIDMGKIAIGTLQELFGNNHQETNGLQTDNLPTNVVIPKEIAEAMYTYWYRTNADAIIQERIKSDQQYALELQQLIYDEEQTERKFMIDQNNTVDENNIQAKSISDSASPSNINDMLDMAITWTAYKTANYNEWLQNDSMGTTNLAIKLTVDNLCDIYPDISRDTLQDIYITNGNSFEKTVNALKSTMPTENITNRLINVNKQILHELSKENELSYSTYKKTKGSSSSSASASTSSSPPTTSNMDFVNTKLPAEISHRCPNIVLTNAVRLANCGNTSQRRAAKECEQYRIMSNYHHVLRVECLHKGIVAAHPGLKDYYMRLCNLHVKKMDMYNQLAATVIINIHHEENLSNYLDLHYLYAKEAVNSLDMFLDKHIQKLRNLRQSYTMVYIITGYGKHSLKGFATVKDATVTRLMYRLLSWTETNPGLLQVKLRPQHYFTSDL